VSDRALCHPRTDFEWVWVSFGSRPRTPPFLLAWASEEKGEYGRDALVALCALGDTGFEAVQKLLTDECRFWKALADRLGPGEPLGKS
jgi:hypothetical protein